MNFTQLMKRQGKFSISMEAMREKPSDVMVVMSHCLILRAEHHVMSNVVEYWGCSELFDKIEEGYVMPEYTLTVKETMQDDLCYVDVKAKRVEYVLGD